MRQDVETDVCPDCRGVWLDRGELDKIINRYDAFDEEDQRRNHSEHQRRYEDHPRRRSFWHELFD
jgi:Zn-finger nucleic acid-binding protein